MSIPRHLIQHAKGHVVEAEALAKTFFYSNPYEVVTQDDPKNPGYRIQYLRLYPPMPRRISLLASDATKNLRSVLDHMGYTVARAAGRTGDGTYFPIGDTFTEANSRCTGPAKDIPKEIFDVMMAFKPYKGGNETIWTLNKLANSNKHESLVRATFFAKELHIRGPGFALSVGKRKSVNDKLPLRWIPPGHPDPNHDLQITTSIRFNDFKGISLEEPAIEFLHRACGIVERILMAVEAESRRLGLTH